MSEIKVGDQVAIGPGMVTWAKDGCHPTVAFRICAATPKPDEIIPWHPALPALARWLSEHPEANVPDLVVMLRSDAAALVEYADAIEANGKILDDDPSPEEARAAEARMDKATYAITPEVLARAKESTR